MSNSEHSRNPGLEELFHYPFMSALIERRTRRVARGVSLEAGGLSHHSTNKPAPISKLQEAVLIVSMGVTGVVTHDGPLYKPGGGKELGTPFLNVTARTASSADNCQATHFFMINDEGIWLIRQPRGREALAMLKELPPHWQDWQEQDWLDAAAAAKVRVADRRMEFPREFPYYLGWNKQISNVPGSTLFVPVVDCTRQYINALLIVAAEPDGQRPLILDDWRRFHPRNLVEFLAWLGGKLGLSEAIPYQPVGGLKWIRNGFVNKNNIAVLGAGGTLRTDHECFFYLQNLMLLGHSLGLGGWVHGAVFPPYIYQRDPAKGWYGLGFRMEKPGKTPYPTPPIPASQPNPVGIDGVLEGLCPPYIKSMDEAVERVLEEKFGNQGNYGDVEAFARSYQSPQNAEEYLRNAQHFSQQAIHYAKDICNYIYDTYGRFPAHTDAFYTPGIWVQFSRLELEYYEKFYIPEQYTRQREIEPLWYEQGG
jgi:hypothetical protein